MKRKHANTVSPLLNINILLADDDLDDCLLFKEILEELPLNTQLNVVHNGEQLMRVFAEQQKQAFHVLFLDLNMPRKNGFECLAEIKRNKKLEQLPVVIFSTSYERTIADLLYEKGASFYICKPSEFSQLKKVICEVITLIAMENTRQPSRDSFVIGEVLKIHTAV